MFKINLNNHSINPFLFFSSENHWRFQTKDGGTLRSPEPQMDQIFPQGRIHDQVLVLFFILNLYKRFCSITCFGPSCCCSSSSAVLSVLLRPRLPAAQPGLPLRSCRLIGRHQARPRGGAQNQGGFRAGRVATGTPDRGGPRLTLSPPTRWCTWPARRSTTTPSTEPSPGGRSTPWRRCPRWAGASTEWACHPR